MQLAKIRIGDKDLPIRIDINVLEAVEEEFDTLEKFRMELLGFRWKRGADGAYVYGEGGKPEIEVTKPSMKAMRFILPLMVNEGLKAQAYEQHKEYEPMDPEAVIMECEIERMYLLEIIEAELARCQKVKKPTPGEGGKNKKQRTSPGSE